MEVAGLAVGVAPLFSLCLDILDRVRDFREYKSSSLQLNARLELAKSRLKQWARKVGIVDGNLINPHHPLLDQPEVERVVGIILNCLLTNFGGSIEDADLKIGQRHRQAEHVHPGWKSLQYRNTDTNKLAKSAHSAKNALLWATGHKAAFTEQVDVFEILIDRLHEVVPLNNTEDEMRLATEAIGRIELAQEGMLDLVRQMRQDAVLKQMKLTDEWLDTPLFDHGFEKHADARLQGTCDWLFKNDTFLSWKSDGLLKDGAKLFWLSAPPGYGKTVLTATLTQQMVNDKTYAVAYFFSSPHVQSRGSPDIVVRSWISQLMRADYHVFELVYSRLTTSTTQKANEVEIWGLFRDLLLTLSDCVLILDGYDEFARSGDVRRDFLQQLKRQIVRTKTRVFISSRPEDEIEAELLVSKNTLGLFLSSHRVTSSDLEADITLYSRDTVIGQLPGKDRAFQQELASSMASKCDGMFLWIKLQRSELRDGKSKKRLREVVDRLPDGLTQSYIRTWNDIMAKSDYDRLRAIEILRWACFAIRPLTVMELTEALAHGYGNTDSCEDDMPDEINESYISGEIKGLCGSLIEVRKGVDDEDEEMPASRVVHLVHISALEFLVAKLPAPSATALRTTEAPEHAMHHMQLAEVCLRYMNCEASWKSFENHTKDNRCPPQQGLMKYAARTWYKHWQKAEMMSEEYKSLSLNFFAPNSPHFGKWARNDVFFGVAWTDRKDENGLNARLYLAILYELDHVVDHLHACGKLDFSPTTFSLGTALSAAVSTRGPFFQKLVSWGADINFKGGRDGSALGTAVACRIPKRVQVLLDQGANLGIRDWQGRPILTLACWSDDLSMMRLLLDHNVDPSDCDDAESSPLFSCIYKRNLEAVRLLLDRGADITLTDRYGRSPLHYACCYGNVEIADLLLDRGADMLLRTKEGRTPLHEASNEGQATIARALLQRNPDLLMLAGTYSKNLWHPIHAAASSGSVETVKVLVDYGADIKVCTRRGFTPLHLACMYDDQVDVVNFLLDSGANVKARTHEKWTPLHCATFQGGLPGITGSLLKRGADVCAWAYHNGDYFQPIHHAAHSGDIETLQVLLDQGADVNVTSVVDWRTPLHFACITTNLETIQFLVENGAEIGARSRRNNTPLDQVFMSGNPEIVDFLLQRGGDAASQTVRGWTPLHSACSGGNIEVARFLLQRGENLSQATDTGYTPLLAACLHGSTELVAFLIGENADISHREADKGLTPLHMACYSDHENIVGTVELLLENGADINQLANDGSTALHVACSNANDAASQVVSLLLDKGADFTQQLHNGEIPLHHAALSGNLNTIRMLLERGAQIPKQVGPAANSYHLMHYAVRSRKPEVAQFFIERSVPIDSEARLGYTPLRIAIFNKDDKMVEMLIDAGADMMFPLWRGDTVMEQLETIWPTSGKIRQWRSNMQVKILPRERIFWLKKQISDIAQDALLTDQYTDRDDWHLFKLLAVNFWRLRAKEDFVFASRQTLLTTTANGSWGHSFTCDSCQLDPIIGERWLCFTCPELNAWDSTDYCGSCRTRLSDIQKSESKNCSQHDLVLVPCYEGDDIRKEDDRAKDPVVRKWLETVAIRYRVDDPMPPSEPIDQST